MKVPSNVFFGCFGNPMKIQCSCCDTKEKNMINYDKYLYMKKNWKQLGLKREKYVHKRGYYNYFPKTKINDSIPKINIDTSWSELSEIISGEWRKNPKYSKNTEYGKLVECVGSDPIFMRIQNEKRE